jgi:hypothetical protein
MAKEFYKHLGATLLFFGVISLLRFELSLGLVELWIGALLGTFILDIDHLIFTYLTRPGHPTSVALRQYIERRDFKGGLLYFGQHHKEHVELSFHSAIFQVLFLGFAFFVLTSTAGFLGKGLVMAAGLHLLVDEVSDLFEDEGHLKKWLFWQFKEGTISAYGTRIYVGLMILVFLGLSVFLL